MEPFDREEQPLSHEEKLAILAKINELLGMPTAPKVDGRCSTFNFNSPVIIIGKASSIDKVAEIGDLQPELKDLLNQLQNAITTEPALNNEDKTEALEQVKTLAKAGKNPNDGAMKKMAKQALRILKAIVNGLPILTRLVKNIGALLSAIATLFGL